MFSSSSYSLSDTLLLAFVVSLLVRPGIIWGLCTLNLFTNWLRDTVEILQATGLLLRLSYVYPGTWKLDEEETD